MNNDLLGLRALVEKLSGDAEFLERFDRVCGLVASCLESGRKVLTAGNGGSAAESQHFAAELAGRYLMERRALPATALTADTTIITAVGNDYGFEMVFARQVEALGNEGDILFLLSTSGKSKNLIEAAKVASNYGLKIIGLLGNDGGDIASLCDVALIVPSSEIPRIQEIHLLMIHSICSEVEKRLFRK